MSLFQTFGNPTIPLYPPSPRKICISKSNRLLQNHNPSSQQLTYTQPLHLSANTLKGQASLNQHPIRPKYSNFHPNLFHNADQTNQLRGPLPTDDDVPIFRREPKLTRLPFRVNGLSIPTEAAPKDAPETRCHCSFHPRRVPSTSGETSVGVAIERELAPAPLPSRPRQAAKRRRSMAKRDGKSKSTLVSGLVPFYRRAGSQTLEVPIS